jgi:hypothetical protein
MLGAVAARLDLLDRDFDISNHARRNFHWPSDLARNFRNNIVNRNRSAQKCDADHIRPRHPLLYLGPRYFRLEEETRYDLDFGRHGRPALHNSRYAACDIVDIHPGMRRATRA